MTKACLFCKEEKDENSFYRFFDRWANKHYLSARCKPCHQDYRRQSATNLRNRKAEKLQLRYGLTFEEWEKIREDEGYACMICGITENELGKVLDVDHCHVSGKARGVLCNPCNNMLGRAKDDVNLLKAAVTYLETYGGGYK